MNFQKISYITFEMNEIIFKRTHYNEVSLGDFFFDPSDLHIHMISKINKNIVESESGNYANPCSGYICKRSTLDDKFINKITFNTSKEDILVLFNKYYIHIKDEDLNILKFRFKTDDEKLIKTKFDFSDRFRLKKRHILNLFESKVSFLFHKYNVQELMDEIEEEKRLFINYICAMGERRDSSWMYSIKEYHPISFFSPP